MAFTKKITIDKTKCGTADTPNYTLTVAGTYTYLRTTGNGGDVVSASGYDIAFYSDSACTTLLPFERVSWSATTGVCEFCVNIGTLAYALDTVIYIKYGFTQASDLQNKSGAWDSYFKAVYHFEDLNDSLGNHNLTDVSTSAGTGILGSGRTITTNQYLYAADSADWDILTNAVTWEGWAYYTTGDTNMTICGQNPNASYYNYMELQFTKAYFDTNTTGGNTAGNLVGATTLSITTWYKVTMTRSGSAWKLYLNGNATPDATLSNAANPADLADTFSIGRINTYGFYFRGTVDEIRISQGIARAPSYVTANYNNISSPSTFYTITENETTTTSTTTTSTSTTTTSTSSSTSTTKTTTSTTTSTTTTSTSSSTSTSTTSTSTSTSSSTTSTSTSSTTSTNTTSTSSSTSTSTTSTSTSTSSSTSTSTTTTSTSSSTSTSTTTTHAYHFLVESMVLIIR